MADQNTAPVETEVKPETGEDTAGAVDPGNLPHVGEIDDTPPAESTAGDTAEMVAEASTLRLALDERPEYVPPQFWNEKGKFVDGGNILKSYAEIRKQNNQLMQDTRAPERYAIPETIEKSLGDDAPNNPVVQAVLTAAKNAGASQKTVNAILDTAWDHLFGSTRQEAEDEEFAVEYCGGNQEEAARRNDALWKVTTAAFQNDAAVFAMAKDVLKTATGRRMLEKVFSGKVSDFIRRPSVPSPQQVGTPAAGHTREELEAMMHDRRYGQDPVFTKRVQKGFELLYPGDVRAAVTDGAQQIGERL